MSDTNGPGGYQAVEPNEGGDYAGDDDGYGGNRTGYDPDPNIPPGGTGLSPLQPDEEESMRRFGWLPGQGNGNTVDGDEEAAHDSSIDPI